MTADNPFAPTSGIGRLVMLLTNTQTIRDGIFFPLLKPEVF
ncbi:MAG: hypothetical protein SFV23_25210 [Planctomycetaceae bacterium]|nr:hypothetical protein [Planctomycetaceae bacterium]